MTLKAALAYLYNWLFPTLETTQIDQPKKINLSPSPDIYLVQFIKTSEPGSNIWSYSNVYFDEDFACRQYNQYLRKLMIGKITKYAGEHEQEYLVHRFLISQIYEPSIILKVMSIAFKIILY